MPLCIADLNNTFEPLAQKKVIALSQFHQFLSAACEPCDWQPCWKCANDESPVRWCQKLASSRQSVTLSHNHNAIHTRTKHKALLDPVPGNRQRGRDGADLAENRELWKCCTMTLGQSRSCVVVWLCSVVWCGRLVATQVMAAARNKQLNQGVYTVEPGGVIGAPEVYCSSTSPNASYPSYYAYYSTSYYPR